jgi:biopolymer transport protein ExbD
MRLAQPPRKRARIEIVPMIDAIFFLLVFFMYSSLSMVHMNGLPVALPQSPEATKATQRPGVAQDAPHLMVVVQTDGCTVGGSPVAPTAVADAVRTRLQAKPDTLVVLQAAKGSGIQNLVNVMDSLNQIRLKDNRTPTILIATEAVTRPDTTTTGAVSPSAGSQP